MRTAGAVRDQAEGLRQLAAHAGRASLRPLGEPTRATRVIAVTSGKGGVGKTSLTVNMAIAAARMGRRVVVVDADLGLANVNIALGINARHSLLDVVRGELTINDVTVEGPCGLRIVPGGNGVAELADLDEVQRRRLVRAFDEIAGEADLLLIDTAAGISKNVLSFLLAADTVLLVTVPEPTALADAYGVIKVLHSVEPNVDMRLIVNRVQRRFEAKAVQNRLGFLAKRFLHADLGSLGSVDDDPVLTLAVKEQQSVVLVDPGAPSSRCIEALAANLLGTNSPHGRGVKGFLDRLAGWFR